MSYKGTLFNPRTGLTRAAMALAVLTVSAPVLALATDLPSGESVVGHAVIEPAYDDSTGSIVYLLTPSRLAPLGPANPINDVNPHAAAPLYLVVYPPGTAGTFNCMRVPGNCPDHDPTIAFVATALQPGT